MRVYGLILLFSFLAGSAQADVTPYGVCLNNAGDDVAARLQCAQLHPQKRGSSANNPTDEELNAEMDSLIAAGFGDPVTPDSKPQCLPTQKNVRPEAVACNSRCVDNGYFGGETSNSKCVAFCSDKHPPLIPAHCI